MHVACQPAGEFPADSPLDLRRRVNALVGPRRKAISRFALWHVSS